ncbi:uncharacterized protein RCO7_06722 [Rhynchosporium graminicola]|uniref:Uncharacterized protein n=1 Tax=Rhynchosporium graminicola TaxID=2792576 RepID=A0A1E1JY21_9HELO|nr:uncharacterized protein RCO7_06722 [Rhynchosporium commune]
MYIRGATARDLHRLAEITITSLKDDPAFDFMWPYRHEYPEDNFFFWQQTLQSWLYDKKITFLVTVLDTSDCGLESQIEIVPDTVISYAIWARHGNSNTARQRWRAKNTFFNNIDALTTKMEVWSHGRKYRRRDADFARLLALDKMGKAIEEQFWKDMPERWVLELMVTHVDFRRRGAATELLKWGLNEADREKAPCKVEASPMGKLLYAANGFHDLALFTVSAEGQKESLELWAMRRDPVLQELQDRTRT